MKRCEHCQAVLSEEEKYCHACGREVLEKNRNETAVDVVITDKEDTLTNLDSRSATIEQGQCRYCPNCGQANPPQGLFCQVCGEVLHAQRVNDQATNLDNQLYQFCPICGEKNSVEEGYCLRCGQELKPGRQQVKPKVEQVASQELAVEGKREEEVIKTEQTMKVKWPIFILTALGVLGLIVFYSNWGRAPFLKREDSLNVTLTDRAASQSEETDVNDQVVFEPSELESVETDMLVEDQPLSESVELVESVEIEQTESPAESSESSNVETSEAPVESGSASSSEPPPPSESVAESSAAVEEAVPEPPADFIDHQAVEALFQANFGSLPGSHSLYYQSMTDQDGRALASEPLIINDRPIAAASIIKLFTLLAAYEASLAGNLDLNSTYTIQADDLVGGTGRIQEGGAGQGYTYHQLMELMITNSDNTANNIVTRAIGGLDQVQATTRALGFESTQVQRLMLDMEALNQGRDNFTTVGDVGGIFRRLSRRDLLTPEIDQKILEILSRQEDHSKLSLNYPSTTKVYSKPGQFFEYGLIHDASLVQLGQASYILIILSQGEAYDAMETSFNNFGADVHQLFSQSIP